MKNTKDKIVLSVLTCIMFITLAFAVLFALGSNGKNKAYAADAQTPYAGG